MSVVSYESDNLITGSKQLITGNDYQLESGESVVRGSVLKRGTTGLVAVTTTSDVPFTVALQTVDASAGVKSIDYILSGSVMSSELVFNVGAIADFRDGLRAVGIIGE